MVTDRPIVHVIDDDDAARDSLAFLLKSARMAVEIHESASEFIKNPGRHENCCVITDVRMPGMSGIELLKHLKKQPSPTPVIVITGHGDVPLAVEAMRYGAFDFIEKPFDDEVLLKSVRHALELLKVNSKRDADRAEILEKLATLSARERQVLDGLVAGLPNKTIAYDLKISPRTVEIYRANTMTKMGAASLSDLVRMALTAGLLETPRND
ncbi:MAG: response regulator FixJ [Xanthobacteraceae bacterium]|jgi:two-component system response regulator FixJ|uniref:response regulator FixJ n=1 Tax=Pseudolabrys sp. TaxID=1960880 RepID=UPI003D10B89F